MNPYRFKLALRAWHPRLSAAQVCKILGLRSRFAQSVGEQRTTPKGRPLLGTNVATFCTFPLAQGSSSALLGAIQKSNQRLKLRETHKITRTGGELEYFLGIFLKGNGGIEFDVELSKELARLKIRLALDIYP